MAFSGTEVIWIFFISAAAGLILGAWFSPRARQARRLAEELDKARKSLQQYQNEVTDHFLDTAKHFRELTTRYEQLFAHLKRGANHLCRDERILSHLSAVKVPTLSLLDTPEVSLEEIPKQPIAMSDAMNVLKKAAAEYKKETDVA